MQKIALVIAMTTLVGCSALGIGGTKTNARPEPITVNCGGFLGWDTCNAKAAETCPKGYDVVKREESLIAQKRILFFTCN